MFIVCFDVHVHMCHLKSFYFVGSGGNNHAVDYYKETGYPLAVKLGTITPDGAGTVLDNCSFVILVLYLNSIHYIQIL